MIDQLIFPALFTCQVTLSSYSVKSLFTQTALIQMLQIPKNESGEKTLLRHAAFSVLLFFKDKKKEAPAAIRLVSGSNLIRS